MDPSFEEHAKATVDKMFSDFRSLARAPVDVGGSSETDEELDDHLWLRLGLLVHEAGDDVAGLSDDLRAYYVSRFFEWETLHDGPDALTWATFALTSSW